MQNKAYSYYMRKANSVGLSSYYKNKVKNGSIDITTIRDENLANKIEEFQQWYEKALDCKDSIDNLNISLSELYKQNFDNISTKFDGMLNIIEKQVSLLNEDINQAEEKGYLVSTKYYEALITKERNQIDDLEKERNEQIIALNDAVKSGTIKKYSEAWYEMVDSINDTTLSIEEANTKILEFKNNIRDLNWKVFDLVQKKISYITKEADFLIKLMEDSNLYEEDGQLTNQGMSTMGLHGMNYDVYMKQADKYAKEMKSINEQLVEDPYNQELVERRQELLELQQEMILAANDEKEAIKSVVSEGIEKELSSLKKLIDTYTDALDSQKNLYDYQKKVKEQTKEITSLQKQLSAYQNDISEETRSKVQKLQVSLSDAKENLEETQYDKYISDSKKILDDLYTDYETVLNQRLDDLDALISDMIQKINDNSSLICETLSNESESVGYTLSTELKDIWTGGNGASQIITTYGDKINSSISSLALTVEAIGVDVQTMITKLKKIAGEEIEKTNTNIVAPKSKPTSTTNTINSGKSKQLVSNVYIGSSSNNTSYSSKTYSYSSSSYSSSKKKGDGKARVGDRVLFSNGIYHEDSNGNGRTGNNNRGNHVYITKIESGAKYPYHVSTGTKLGKGDLGWLKLSQLKEYASGKKNIKDNSMAWTQEKGTEYIIRPSDGAILTPLAKQDSVLKASASNNIWNMANNPTDFIRDNLFESSPTSSIPNTSSTSNNTSINLDNITFNLPNVENYEEFFYKLQHDKRFEKFAKSITTDRMFGGSSLKKYRI